MKLKNKVILITGASRGIGRAIAIACAKDGATLVLTYKSKHEEMQKTVKLCERFANPVVMKCDITKKEDVIDLFRIIRGSYGIMYGLVNNAGIVRDRTLEKMHENEWQEVIATNLSSLYYVTKPAIPLMTKGGSIVNISSIVGIRGNGGQTNYAATKAGVIGFTKSLAKELKKKNIRVNSVAPSLIKTDMTRGLNVPASLVGRPEDVAIAVVSMLSPTYYKTGQVIRVKSKSSI